MCQNWIGKCFGLRVELGPIFDVFEVWASEVHQSFVILNSQSSLHFGVLLSNYLPLNQVSYHLGNPIYRASRDFSQIEPLGHRVRALSLRKWLIRFFFSVLYIIAAEDTSLKS